MNERREAKKEHLKNKSARRKAEAERREKRNGRRKTGEDKITIITEARKLTKISFRRLAGIELLNV